MLKTIVVLLILVVFTQSLTDKQKLQLGLNGAFTINSLPLPTTIINCFDDASAALTVNYISQLFTNAGLANTAADIISLIPTMPAFGHSLPPAVKSCVATNP